VRAGVREAGEAGGGVPTATRGEARDLPVAGGVALQPPDPVHQTDDRDDQHVRPARPPTATTPTAFGPTAGGPIRSLNTADNQFLTAGPYLLLAAGVPAGVGQLYYTNKGAWARGVRPC
jgi:hypothetical protein